MALSTTLTSTAVGATSTAIVLDPTKRLTQLQITVSGSSLGLATIEGTLDDPTMIPLGGPALTWAAISSVMTSSVIASGAGQSYTYIAPLGGVRINGSSNGTGTTLTLKALQAITA